MEGVKKRFGATIALDGVDLTVRAGEVLALVGENGAGKSTLMKTLSGAYYPDEGKMWLNGEPYAPQHPLDARNAGVSMIYQELSLARHLTVMENIVLGMEPAAGPFVKWKEFSLRAAEAMKQLGRSDIRPDTPVQKLSIASQQLVEIGRAIAVGARVLVLDEPTSSLARNDIERLFELVHRLKKQGLGIVYISHFLEEVRALCDRFTVLRDGKSVGTAEVASTPNEDIIAMMVGRSVADLSLRAHPRGSYC
jgi:ribose transport system ATP-binding protein